MILNRIIRISGDVLNLFLCHDERFFARTWVHACGPENSNLNHWLPCPEQKISPKARWHVLNLNSLSDLGAGIPCVRMPGKIPCRPSWPGRVWYCQSCSRHHLPSLTSACSLPFLTSTAWEQINEVKGQSLRCNEKYSRSSVAVSTSG